MNSLGNTVEKYSLEIHLVLLSLAFCSHVSTSLVALSGQDFPFPLYLWHSYVPILQLWLWLWLAPFSLLSYVHTFVLVVACYVHFWLPCQFNMIKSKNPEHLSSALPIRMERVNHKFPTNPAKQRSQPFQSLTHVVSIDSAYQSHCT